MYKKLTATLFKKAVPARYDHINFTPPKGVREEAKRGLKLRREHKRGGLSTQQASKHGIGSGVQRATNLASGASVSPRTVRRMRAFFARHSAYKEHHKDKTSASYISWLLWGGDAGERWANKVYAQMERADDEMKKAGGEQAGHKYIRRIPVARRGKMGYRYIYRRDKKRRKELRRKDGESKEPQTAVTQEGTYVPVGASKEPQTAVTQEGTYVPVGASKDPQTAMTQTAVTQDVLDFDIPPPIPEEWDEAEVAEAIAEGAKLHAPTFNAIAEAPMGEMVVVDGAPAGELVLFKEALGQTEGLEDVEVVIAHVVEVENDKVRLPLKDIGKATALSLMLIATESYRTLTTGDPNAVSVTEIEGFSKRELNRMDREAVREAKAELRDSLNKDREEARAMKEEARAKDRAEKEDARKKERAEKEKAKQAEKEAKQAEKEAKQAEKEAERAEKERQKQERADQLLRDKMDEKEQRAWDEAEGKIRSDEAKEAKEKQRAEAKQQREEKRAQEKQQREEAKQQREEKRAQEKQQREEAKRQREEKRAQEKQQREEEKQQREEERAQEKQQREEAKQQRERDRAEKERLKQTQKEQREREREEEKKRNIEEAEKRAEREFEFRRQERELAEAEKEKQKIRAEERKEKRKIEAEERREKRKIEAEERREKKRAEAKEKKEANKKVPKKVPKKQAKKALSSVTDEQALPRRVRRTKIRKSLVTMYTGRGSDETTS